MLCLYRGRLAVSGETNCETRSRGKLSEKPRDLPLLFVGSAVSALCDPELLWVPICIKSQKREENNTTQDRLFD